MLLQRVVDLQLSVRHQQHSRSRSKHNTSRAGLLLRPVREAKAASMARASAGEAAAIGAGGALATGGSDAETQASQPARASGPATLLATRVPPLPESCALGARVEHLTPHREGPVAEVVAEQLGLPLWFVEELLDFGAVYHCAVHPPPPAGAPLTAAMRAKMEGARALALAEHASSKHQQLTKLSQPQRITQRNLAVRPGAYIRVHVHPKRFPAFYDFDWKARVLHDGPGYVVVDKPAGVQVVPRVDNAVECVLSAVGKALGLAAGPPPPLLPAHRLDCWTEGVLVLGKDPAFVARFSEALRGDHSGGGSNKKKKKEDQDRKKKRSPLKEDANTGASASGSSGSSIDGEADHSESDSEHASAGQQGEQQQQEQQQRRNTRALAKVYRALSRGGPVPLGTHVHYARVNVKLRGLPAFTRIVGGVGAAETAAEEAAPAPANAAAARTTAAQTNGSIGNKKGQGPAPADAVRCELRVLSCRRVALGPGAAARFGEGAAWESEVLLVTGRTHQIRAQLAALGCPLLGDDLYDGGGGGGSGAPTTGRVSSATAHPGNAGNGLQQQQGNQQQGQQQQQQQGQQQQGQQQQGQQQQQQGPQQQQHEMQSGGGPAVVERDLNPPEAPLGLQAARLEVLGDGCGMGPSPPYVFEAGPPWWRRNSEEQDGLVGGAS